MRCGDDGEPSTANAFPGGWAVHTVLPRHNLTHACAHTVYTCIPLYHTTHVHTHTHTHTYTHTHTHTHTTHTHAQPVHTHTHTCTHTYTHTYNCTHIEQCTVNACIHIHACSVLTASYVHTGQTSKYM